MLRLSFLALLLALAAVSCASTSQRADPSGAPGELETADQQPKTGAGSDSDGASGPQARRPLSLFHDRRIEPSRYGDGDNEISQIRPFYWKSKGPRGTRINILGPFIRYRENASYRRLDILPNIHYSARHSPADERMWWFILFPLAFLGHDDFLVLPFGGVSHGLLGLDEVMLVTPFYARTKTISHHPTDPDVFTVRHVMFPLIAWGSDGKPGGRRKFRVAPFYGKQKWRDGAESGFVMWPFYNWRKHGEARSYFVFPFYGRATTPTRRETSIMFPIYNRVEDLRTGATDTAVYPFWRRTRGSESVDIRRAWPITEYRRFGWNTEEYVAWPIWRRAYRDDGVEFAKLTWVAPFYRRVEGVDRKDGRHRKKTILWPIGRWEKARDGTREVAFPALSPFDSPELREFAEPIRPFVSLYHRKIKPNGTREASALFGLVQTRRDRVAKTKKVRILGGLLGWDRTPQGRHLRLLWALRLRLGK